MEIILLDRVDSTQEYLLKLLKESKVKTPIAVISKEQTNGIGSRDNSWTGGEGNLFVSFAIDINKLPSDLAIASSSIYFSFIMKEILLQYNSNIWLKWPNDFYIGKDKIGGTITKKIDNILVCGIGINLRKNKNSYKALDIGIEPIVLVKKYLLELDKSKSWKQVFIKYKLEFNNNKNFYTHILKDKVSLRDSILCSDGSLIIEDKKVYSLR